MKKIVLISVILLIAGKFLAQDKHFTQFYAAPLTLNPALTGAFDGKYRVGAIYRDQWRGVLDKPYTTFAAAMDLRLDLHLRTLEKDRLGVGILFFRDKIGGIDFSTNQLSVSTAYHKSLNSDNTQYLSLGVQVGLAQRNLNYENLVFQDQWNGETAYSEPTTENFPENSFGFPDISMGLNYAYSDKKRTSFFAGLGWHHILQPDVSFYSQDGIEGSPLWSKFSGQISAQFPIAYRISMSPRLLFSVQGENAIRAISFQSGSHLEINAGTNFRFLLEQTGGTSLHLGAWVRPVRNFDSSFNIDAVVLMTGLEYNNVLLGLSYDATITDFSKSYRRSAFEISVTYLGEYENEEILCPSF